MQTVSDAIGTGEGSKFDGEWLKLADIENKQVAILGFNGPFESKTPGYPDYYVVGITDPDDVDWIVSIGSEPLKHRLDKLEKAGAFPVLGTFRKVPSSKNPSQSYWSLT